MTRSAPAATSLALDGGTPVRTVPVPSWPHFDGEQVEAALRVLRSGEVNYWTGTEGRRFEVEFASWAGTRHAVALANGTVALEIALRALGVGSGMEVVVPAATFIATASAVVAVGAVPVVADVERTSQCLSVDTVQPVLSERTAAVVVVHLAGWPADTEALATFCRDRGLRLLEDCAQAHGARSDCRAVGSTGDAAAWSFCQDKIMTTAGEGGAVTTDDTAVWRSCWEYKDHGKSLDAVRAAHPPGFRWLHHTFGTNARMTEIQSAVGREQLRALPGFLERRRANAASLLADLSGLSGLRLPDPPDGVEHAWYRVWAHVVPDRLRPGWDRDRVVAAILAEGVPCAHGGCTEIHREQAFSSRGGPVPWTPVAAELGRTAVVLPAHPTLTEQDVSDMAVAVRKVLDVASG